MKDFARLLFGAQAALLLATGAALAQVPPSGSTTAIVVGSCGTPPSTYTAGQNRQLTQDTGGKLCDGGSGTPTSVTPAPLTPLASQQTLTLSGSAVALTIPATATTIDIMPEGAAGTNNACLRYRDDGTDPTASVGFPLAPLQGVFGYKVTALPIKFILATGATCTVTVNFYK